MAHLPKRLKGERDRRAKLAPFGQQSGKVLDGGPYEVWMKPLADGSKAVILFNRGSVTMPIRFKFEDVGLAPTQSVRVRNLWTTKDLPEAKGRFEAKVAPHDVVMLRVTPADR